MNKYLVDSNHLSAYLDRQPALTQRMQAALQAGDRLGICLPVLCEYRAGIQISRRYRQNLVRLQATMAVFRFWPTDEQTAVEFATLFQELRSTGRMLAQFDLLIATVARQFKLTLLTADRDFQSVSRLRIENWL